MYYPSFSLGLTEPDLKSVLTAGTIENRKPIGGFDNDTLFQTQPPHLLFYTCGAHRAGMMMGLPHIDYHLTGTTCTLQFQCLVQC